jgi:hypothetical protein
MKKTILFIWTLTLLSCGQQNEKATETSSDQVKDSVVQGGKSYTVTKEESEPDETTDTTFTVGKDKFKVTIKNYAKGDFTIADTSENQITLFKENFIDITINDKTITIDKSLFSNIYPDKNQLYHSCFGKAFIDKIDKTNKKIVFMTFFGYHQSDFGEMLYYSISFDGKFEFIKAGTPKEEA